MARRVKVTLATLAEELNVSPATVSRALSGKPGRNAARIRERARELNFSPNLAARNLRQSLSHTVGVLITRDISRSWYSQLVCKLEEKLALQNKTMQLSISRYDGDKERTCLEAFRGSRVEGIIVGPVFRRDALGNIEKFMESCDLPVVCFSCMEDLPVNYVTVDCREGARRAVGYLIDKGHCDIVYVGCPQGDMENVFRTRRQGFEEGMFAHDLPLYKHSIVVSETSRRGGWEAVRGMIRSGRKLPTALFCHNDEVAFGATLALQQAGIRVPDDVSLVGYDDLAECEMAIPSLTTMAGRMTEMAEELVKVALSPERSATGDAFVQKTIVPQLVERDSVRDIRNVSPRSGASATSSPGSL